MMSVLEYAEDINKTVEEVLKKCKELNIKASSESDLLDDEAITELDSTIDNGEEIEDLVEEIIEKKDIQVDNVVKKQKLNKKPTFINKKTQKELAKEKKEMYKNKEKLMSNKPVNNEKDVLYKENEYNKFNSWKDNKYIIDTTDKVKNKVNELLENSEYKDLRLDYVMFDKKDEKYGVRILQDIVGIGIKKS